MTAGGPSALLEADVIRVHALYIGTRIAIRALEKRDLATMSPLTIDAGAGGCAVIFRYGVVVLFNLTPEEETAFIETLRPYIGSPRAEPELEEVEIRVEPKRGDTIQGDLIYLNSLSMQHLHLVAEVMAKSVVLDYYENRMGRSFELIEPFALRLMKAPLRWIRSRDLLRHIGEVLIHQQEIVGRIEIGEKPELLWDHPELERLYARLESEFEIRERHLALERKQSLIARTAETVLDILQTRRSIRLEWYIVILIVVEILFTIYELFFHG